MKEKHDEPGCPSAERQRSAEDIRRDIQAERDTIEQAVGSLSGRIRNALDWRTYVRQAPFASLVAAAALGALAAAMLTRRKTPVDRIVEAAARSSKRIDNQGLLGLGMSALVTKLLSEMAKSTASGITREGVRAAREGAGYSETVH
jgi:hypothetical protein